jgi:hypothetical protein
VRLARTVTRALVAAALAALGLGGVRDASALSRSPLALEVRPSGLAAGEPATVRITGAPDASLAGERVDLYVASVFVPGGAFLTPAGAWSSEPVPIRANVALGAAAPVVVDWPRAGPPGWTMLALVIVRHGADPFARAGWMFRPVEAWIRVDPAPRPIDGRDGLYLAGLFVLTLAGVLVTLRYPRGL